MPIDLLAAIDGRTRGLPSDCYETHESEAMQ